MKNALRESSDGRELNERRAAWAKDAVNEFQANSGAEPETVLRDLLSDLMHLCNQRRGESDWDFEDELKAARRAYHEEVHVD